MKHGKPDDEFGQELGFNAVKKVPFPWRLRRLKIAIAIQVILQG